MAWTTEDKFILRHLFAPEKAEAVPPAEGAGRVKAEKDPDWSVFLEKTRREGVSAVIFHNLRKQGLAARIPTEILSALSRDYHANLKRNMLIIGELRTILSRLQAAGIPCIVLKGIALAEFVYPSLAMRGMSDVDLLIRKEHLQQADGMLASLGFLSRDLDALEAVRNPAGYLASLEYRKDPPSPLNLHLHWHLVNTSVPATAFIREVDLERIWKKSGPVRMADGPARMLCPEHLILYLCEHALRVGHSFDRLILLCDLFYAVNTFADSLGWIALVEEARRTGFSRFAYHGLTIAKAYTGLAIPEICLAQLKPLDLSRSEKLFLRLQRCNRRIRGSSYLIYLAMNRGMSAKAGFIARTFFPPAQIILQRRYLKEGEFKKSLYLSRIGEICSYIWELLAPGRTNTTGQER